MTSYDTSSSLDRGHVQRGAFTGLIIFVVLALLTGFEFFIARNLDANVLPLVAIAIVKAVLILWYFMHLARSWLARRGER